MSDERNGEAVSRREMFLQLWALRWEMRAWMLALALGLVFHGGLPTPSNAARAVAAAISWVVN